MSGVQIQATTFPFTAIVGTFVVGDVLYADTTQTLARLADVATGSVLVSGGVGVAPAWSSAPQVSQIAAGTTLGSRRTADFKYTATDDVSISQTLAVEIDVTNDAETTYQAVAGLFTCRYRGSANESGSNKGPAALVSLMFVYNTGTTELAGGYRLDSRNLGPGTVQTLYGCWIPSLLNSGGGTIDRIICYWADTQTVATLNIGFYGELAASGTSRYNCYMSGTAPNYFAGSVGIGETSPDYKLDVNGTFGFAPGASVTPVDNGDVVIEATNNTTLTFKLRGSDGVVRSATLTLA